MMRLSAYKSMNIRNNTHSFLPFAYQFTYKIVTLLISFSIILSFAKKLVITYYYKWARS